MLKQNKEPVFDYSDQDGQVFCEFPNDNVVLRGNVTNLLLLTILRELEAQRKGGKK